MAADGSSVRLADAPNHIITNLRKTVNSERKAEGGISAAVFSSRPKKVLETKHRKHYYNTLND